MVWTVRDDIKRGEVYFVDLNPVQGREQAGPRPVLVLSAGQVSGAVLEQIEATVRYCLGL
jgi:hypothetical protein